MSVKSVSVRPSMASMTPTREMIVRVRLDSLLGSGGSMEPIVRRAWNVCIYKMNTEYRVQYIYHPYPECSKISEMVTGTDNISLILWIFCDTAVFSPPYREKGQHTHYSGQHIPCTINTVFNTYHSSHNSTMHILYQSPPVENKQRNIHYICDNEDSCRHSIGGDIPHRIPVVGMRFTLQHFRMCTR